MKKILSILILVLILGTIPALAIQNPIGIQTNLIQATVVYAPDASDSYICSAAVGSSRSAAVWQCYYVYINGTTTTITWANGNANYSNIATAPQSLSYS